MADTLRELEDSEQPRKKIKVRKGTRSCWECKRRKIRCTFATATNAVCLGCKGRGTTCVSQEYPDEPALAEHQKAAAVENRLGRVEALVEHLVEQLVGRSESNLDAVVFQPSPSSALPLSGVGGSHPPTGSEGIPPSVSVLPQTRSARVATYTGLKYKKLCHALFEAWPSRHELELLFAVPPGTSAFLLHKGSCMRDLASAAPRDILQLPEQRALHPVLIGRKLLLLSTFLQGLPSEHTNARWSRIQTKAAEAAELVTSNDELGGSIEGIECLVMHGMYQDNAGNISRAWITVRRAVAVAQMMGLHRGTSNVRGIRTLDPATRERLDPEYFWFRLVQADRYLSLMLGLPQGLPDSIFASPRALESCEPVERMRRIACLAAGRTLQRTDAERLDLATTREIDALLHEASSAVPPQWWLPPSYTGQGPTTEDVVRLMDQLVYFHLVARLHLPYLLHSPSPNEDCQHNNNNQGYLYSKITAVTASRELLSRFVALRTARPTSHYCPHGTDFLAFTAAAILCLAHIEAWRQRQTSDTSYCVGESPVNQAGDDDNNNTLCFLLHQRATDRALLERALAGISIEVAGLAPAPADTNAVGDGNGDSDKNKEDDHPANTTALTAPRAKMATILRHLLLIEADAARGGRYQTRSSCSPSASPLTSSNLDPEAGASDSSGSSWDDEEEEAGGEGDGDSEEDDDGGDDGKGGRGVGGGGGRGGGSRDGGGLNVGKVSEGGRLLRIFVPHFGTIEVQKADAADDGFRERQQQHEEDVAAQYEGMGDVAGDGEEGLPDDFSWALQGVDIAFENLIRGVVEPGDGGAGEEAWMSGWSS